MRIISHENSLNIIYKIYNKFNKLKLQNIRPLNGILGMRLCVLGLRVGLLYE